MGQKNIQFYFFISLTLLLVIFSFLIFKPYWVVLFISALLSIIFYPLYQKFVTKLPGKHSISAGLTLVVIVFVIVLPTIFISASVFNQAVGLYNSIIFGGGAEKLIFSLNEVYKSVNSTLFPFGTPIDLNLNDHIESGLSWIISNFSKIFSFVFNGFLGFILMLITIYYLLINGDKIKPLVVKWSPLPDNYDEEIINNLKNSVDTVVRGRFLVAIAQGLFMGFGFFIFGVPNPVLWGFVGAVASLIPILGTSLITIPASIYMFMVGSFFGGVGVLVWGALAVGLIDDVLGFFIMKRGIKIHPLFILFSILGGVEFLGPIGFLAGPIIISSLIAVLRIYPFLFGVKEGVETENKLEEQIL